MSVARFRQFVPLFFYTTVALCLTFFAARTGFNFLAVVTLLVVGFLSWSLIEYGLHRFIFHYDAKSPLGRRILYDAHLGHHEDPAAVNRIFASLYLSVPISATYWLLAWVATGSFASASYLFIGMASGYFAYEWLHFQCHHGKSRLPILRYLRKYHLLHHHKTPELRFGVSSPLLDLVFGTFRPVNESLSINRRAS
jgi:sterol desaturase/sphingolipid hydroxylase (fatty acid hydroxylase superfamily)